MKAEQKEGEQRQGEGTYLGKDTAHSPSQDSRFVHFWLSGAHSQQHHAGRIIQRHMHLHHMAFVYAKHVSMLAKHVRMVFMFQLCLQNQGASICLCVAVNSYTQCQYMMQAFNAALQMQAMGVGWQWSVCMCGGGIISCASQLRLQDKTYARMTGAYPPPSPRSPLEQP